VKATLIVPYSNENTIQSVDNLIESASPHQKDAPNTQPDSIVAECPPQEQGNLELGGVLCSVSEKFLTPEHEAHIAGRGLLNPWARECSFSASIAQASLYGISTKSAGILFIGQNGQVQFRPDIRRPKRGKKEPPKYLTSVGEFDAFVPPSPDNPLYWEIEALKREAFYINDVPYILLTEGVFKALAGCSNGIPTISLLGVEQGLTGKARDPENQRFLVPALRKLAEAGFGFIIAFDADAATNPNVRAAERKLAKQLAKFNVPVRSVTGDWAARSEIEFGEIKATNGMDDFIQHKGIEEFRAILTKAKLFGEKESDTEGEKKEKAVTSEIIGDQLAEDLRDQLLYSSSHKSWMKYSLEFPGVWTQVADDYVRHIVHNLCRARGVMPNNNFIKNVLGWLQRTLFEFKWLERPSNELLPFEDGILNLLTNEWHEHAPGFRLTWVLPRKYQGSAVHAGWKRIEIWLDQATRGNKRMKDELLAFCAATLRGMSGLQKFLIGTGYGGTGKGTYTQLVTLLVGEQNVWVGKLEDLTKQDKIAELQTKRLAIFDDQEKYTGNLSNFRSMTGGALINGRNLYERSVTFRFPGLALITANQPCFPASALSWLKRRIIQHEFAYTPTKRNRNLVREFEPEISAFTKYLLSIPVAEIERILDPEDQSINGTFWEDRVRADPMAAWLNELVIHDAEAKTAVGADKNEWKDATYVPTNSTLFGSYNHYCTGGGYSAKGKNNFSADLVELCREVLGWKDVSKERAAVGVVIKGLRLRTDTDKGIATVEELLEQKNVDLGLHCVDLNVDLEPLPHKDYVDHVDLTSRIAEKNENTSADSNLILGAGTDSASLDQVTITADAIETLPPPKVYTVYTSHTEQDIQPSQGLHSGLHSGQHELELEPPPTYSGAAEQVLIAPPELETAPTVPTPPTVPPITPSTGSSQSNLLLLQDYARRIGEALGYQSPATAKAIAEYIQESIVNQDITESELAEVAGIENWQAFTALRNLTENEKNLVEIVQQAIASNDAETAKSVLSSLKEVCELGAADRQKVWNSGLTESEREAFSALIQ
jgi:putative DNA primase/helicase